MGTGPRALPSTWRWGLVAAALLALVLVPFALFGARLDAAVVPWLGAAPTGAFAAGCAALLAADFVLPVPSSVVATAAGARLGVELGAPVVLLGLQLGCVLAWLTGRWLGDPAIDRLVGAAEQQRARRWLGAPGGLSLLAACRAVPVLSEATALLAGSVRVPFGRFCAVTAAANAGLALAYAVLGALSTRTGSLALAVAGAVAPPALAILWVRHRARTERVRRPDATRP